ncbi:nucleotidyltransferase domain-containing protein [Candidatus Woesearchaeota archaeon]|nr:nucleotidyltransferase domain-containing protein [Candidatus Woesearchaeota archaeon]
MEDMKYIKEKIKQLCKSLEKEKNIRILFAVENGSRAWRMESKDSDYDVRFVFVRPVEEYIQINRPGDVIEAAFDKNFNKHPIEGSFIDLVGFDVFKFAKMLSSSNPTTIEWLTTDIIYYGKQNKVFKEFATKNFNSISLYHHYKSMCRNNYLKYLKSGDLVTYKKYLYAFRGLINAKWVAHKKTIPPIIFRDALKEMKGILPDYILKKLNEIIKLKSKGKEKQIIQNIVKMDEYIEEFLKDDSEAPKEKAHATLNELNAELRKIVL